MTANRRGYTMYTLDIDYDEELKWAVSAREWLDDNISDVKLSTIAIDEETDEEFETDAGEIDARDICREILGRELFSTIY